MSKAMVGLVVFVCATLYAAESFVVKKTIKAPSSSKCKEQCCDALFDTLRLTPQLYKRAAHVQEISMNLLPFMYEAKFFKGFNKKQLQALSLEFEQFQQRQEMINRLAQEQVAFVRKQHNAFNVRNTT